MTKISNMLSLAMEELGVTEIAGPEDNSRIIEYSHSINHKWVTSDSTVPWCGFFVGFLAHKLGFDLPKLPGLAKDWLNTQNYKSGRILTNNNKPTPGNDLAVFHRGDPTSKFGHIAVYLGHSNDGKEVFVIGGNQGNKVSIASYPASRLAGFVRLGNAENTITAPSPNLATKDAVRMLQRALNIVGYECGAVDGDYGPKTKQAVYLLKKENNVTPYNTTYDNAARIKLADLLMS